MKTLGREDGEEPMDTVLITLTREELIILIDGCICEENEGFDSEESRALQARLEKTFHEAGWKYGRP